MARPPPISVAKTHRNSPASLSISAATAPREQSAVEQFTALESSGVCRHAFIRRIAGIDVFCDKAEALRRLETAHRNIRRTIGVESWPLLTAEQVHGNKIAIVDGPVESSKQFAGCDGLITNQEKILLGIYVADCCAVHIVDPKMSAIGLVHSGRKGTELGVVTNAITQMIARFGSRPSDLIVQLSPCIRPPHYEIDFAAKIIEECRAQGVNDIHDSGICTACHVDLYYSYRAEKGRTGRMFALLSLE
ncbi:MAG: polyphenol oxidase family protein [Verrucomicrobiota bacterium]